MMSPLQNERSCILKNERSDVNPDLPPNYLAKGFALVGASLLAIAGQFFASKLAPTMMNRTMYVLHPC
jgi:hypothetical protein